MFKCIPCVNTKSLLEDITTHMKAISPCIPPHPMHSLSTRRPDPATGTMNGMAEGTKRLKNKRKKREQEQQMGTDGGGGHGEGEGGGEEEKGGEAKEEEWVAEVDRGVLISFGSLPGGGNRIDKIRFREGMFDASQAHKWWEDNHEKVLNLYSVQRWPGASHNESGASSVSAEESSHTQAAGSSDYNSATSSSSGPAQSPGMTATGGIHERRVIIPGRLVEWVVEDQPGVFITIRSLPGDAKELRRVELSRERFGEVKARVWWEENKDRLHQQYT